jgi:hypothetical protein
MFEEPHKYLFVSEIFNFHLMLTTALNLEIFSFFYLESARGALIICEVPAAPI